MIMSIGVVIASLFIYYDSNLKIADPICTYIFSIIVCFTVYPIVKDCMRVLLEGVPDSFNTRKFLEDIRKIEGVMAIHDFHIWSISVGKLALSMHIQSSTNSMKAVVFVHRCAVVLGQALGTHLAPALRRRILWARWVRSNLSQPFDQAKYGYLARAQWFGYPAGCSQDRVRQADNFLPAMLEFLRETYLLLSCGSSNSVCKLHKVLDRRKRLACQCLDPQHVHFRKGDWI